MQLLGNNYDASWRLDDNFIICMNIYTLCLLWHTALQLPPPPPPPHKLRAIAEDGI